MLNLEPFEKLDRLIHERGRLAIMSLLAASESLTFTEVKGTLGLTDGNLSVHIRKLEEAGYVSVDKQFVDRKPRTSYALTSPGRAAFALYIGALEEIVKQSQPVDDPAERGAGPVLLQPGIAGAK